MKTSVTELPDSRVRVDVEVDATDVEHSVEHAAGHLAEDLRLPGFRKGKVPPQLVVQRFGREAVLDAALREFLPSWYERALLESGVEPIGDPSLDVDELPGSGEPLAFRFEVAVRPAATLGEYLGLEVGRATPEVPAEAVDEELDRLRESFASLTAVDREARREDLLVIDYVGTIEGEPFEGSEAKDFLVELGRPGLMAEFDQALTGRSAGDELTVEVTFSDDHRPAELAGRSAAFEVRVKEVREKELPELDDDFASDASEFETIGELREAIRARLGEALEQRAEQEFREAAVDAAAATATIELPEEVVRARATDTWERVERSLQARGVSPQAYLRMQGKSREEIIAEATPDAERALRREATLAAVADAERIEASDEELIEALGPGDGDEDPHKLLARLRESGRDALLRQELRLRRAAELIAESATPIALEQAEARERLWTPEKGARERDAGTGGGAEGEPAPRPGELWTPGG